MEGVAGISLRMAEIRSQIAVLNGPPPAVSAGTGGTAFADALTAAMSTGATGTTGAGATSAAARGGKLNAAGVPADLAAFGNGRIPTSELASVGATGHKLWAPAAASLGALGTAARRDGVTIGITDSYRPYAEQVDLVRRKGLYSQGGLAAKPGTSDHGWGMATDLDLNPKAQAWMRTNAAKFGFVEDTPREPWHWAYKASG